MSLGGNALAAVFRSLRGDDLTPPQVPALPEPPALGTLDGYADLERSLAASPPLPAVPALPWGDVPALPAPLGGRSYASTFDVSVACLPCFQQHSSGAAAAMERAKVAADAGDMQGAKLESLRALGEVAAFRLWDLTPEKMAATDPETLAAIGEVMPFFGAMADAVPAPPVTLLGAYAGIAESPRFARGAPTEHDRAQIAERLLPAQRWFADLERVEFAPDRMARLSPAEHARAEAALDQVREARHLLGEPGTVPSAEEMEQASERLLHAAAALTPDPTRAQVTRAAEKAQETVDALDGHLRAQLLRGVGA